MKKNLSTKVIDFHELISPLKKGDLTIKIFLKLSDSRSQALNSILVPIRQLAEKNNNKKTQIEMIKRSLYESSNAGS
ncbi:MAG: hypothetical protein U9P79_03355 [Candidatus Cloacimonadota bacterium]|nr:hypothetical protein [Candidatus Cloacimonadota bacterium]